MYFEEQDDNFVTFLNQKIYSHLFIFHTDKNANPIKKM